MSDDADYIWHDPACPFDKHCYCGEDGKPPPHDRSIRPRPIKAKDALEKSAATIKELRAALAKARAHPADVVEAAKRIMGQNGNMDEDEIIAAYILKDV